MPSAHADKHEHYQSCGSYEGVEGLCQVTSAIDIFSLCQCAQSTSIARYSNLPSNSAIALSWGAKPRTMLALVHLALDHHLFSVIADLGHICSFELMRAYISPSLPQCPTGHTVMTIYNVPLCPIINVTILLYIATIETLTKQRNPQCQTKRSTCC
jgi:hypothetical protein